MRPDELPASEARVLVALIRVYSRDGRATVRDVAAEADRSIVVTHKRLIRLRQRGLVLWSDAERGTLQPRVWPVAS